MNKSEVYAKHMKARISPKKVAPVMDLVRGKPVEEAKLILAFDRTKAAALVLKVLKSAEANAVNNNKFEKENLVRAMHMEVCCSITGFIDKNHIFEKIIFEKFCKIVYRRLS